MARKAKSAGGGPGTAKSGPITTTFTPVFGRGAGKRKAAGRAKLRGKSGR